MYEVQQVFTYEWVTVGTFYTWYEAQDKFMELAESFPPDTIRIVEV